jgi:hypothetical protein
MTTTTTTTTTTHVGQVRGVEDDDVSVVALDPLAFAALHERPVVAAGRSA